MKPGRKRRIALWHHAITEDGCWQRLMTKWKPLIWQEWKHHGINPHLLFSCPLLYIKSNPAPHSLRIMYFLFCTGFLRAPYAIHLTQGKWELRGAQEHLSHLLSAGKHTLTNRLLHSYQSGHIHTCAYSFTYVKPTDTYECRSMLQ